MTKHTPGPWVIVHEGVAQECQPALILGNCLKILIDKGESFADPLSDACLIAAAPDLLEACKEYCDAFEKPDIKCLDIRKMKQAIAKAEGKKEDHHESNAENQAG